jgi:putative glutamine amidotransferase
MRLVSASYADYYPFHNIEKFTTLALGKTADDLREGDCLLLWGGADIHPSLYGKGRSQHSGAGNKPSYRDVDEWGMIQRAKELKLPIIGVCRGAQMLCAAAGGFLIQHVNNHGGFHDIVTYDGKTLHVNSMHHQMMHPADSKHELIAWCAERRSDVYYDDVGQLTDVNVEPEFIYFPEIRGFAMQWHPECMDDDDASAVYMNKFIEERL